MYLGIDFGTCYSSAAIALNGKKTQLVREPLKHGYSFPSCVYFTEQGDLLAGQAAENQHILHPERYRAGFKRDLGSPEPFILGNQPFLPEELVAALIGKLKNQADEMVKDSITEAVITVPATYRVNKRKLMEKAGKAAGFKEVRLLEEPVTAAIYYAQQYELGEEEIILVYDLGAGTFDATLLQKQGANYQILATPVGLSHCGGMDFDREIYQDLLEHCSESLRERLDAHNRSKEAFQSRAIVADLCRTLKHQLSDAQMGEILIPVTMESYALNRQDFNQMIAPLVEETLASCHQLVKNAGINWEQVDQVLLVGGSCRIPYVKLAVEKVFNQPPLLVDDPELAVCLGAAIDGFKKEELEKEKAEFKLREKTAEEERQRIETERLELEKQARFQVEHQLKEKEAEEEFQRVEREKLEAENQAKVEAERNRKEREVEEERQRLEKERLEAEKQARVEAERKQKEREAEEESQQIEREKLEAEKQARVEAERNRKEREAEEERQRVEREKLEAENQAKVEAERNRKEREAEKERQRIERERIEKEKLEIQNKRKNKIVGALVGSCLIGGTLIFIFSLIQLQIQQQNFRREPTIIHQPSPVVPQNNSNSSSRIASLTPQEAVSVISNYLDAQEAIIIDNLQARGISINFSNRQISNVNIIATFRDSATVRATVSLEGKGYDKNNVLVWETAKGASDTTYSLQFIDGRWKIVHSFVNK
jgi:molecular chaperone DnaK (HSP70)